MGKGKGPQERIPQTSADRDECQETHILRPENDVTVRLAVKFAYLSLGHCSLSLWCFMFFLCFHHFPSIYSTRVVQRLLYSGMAPCDAMMPITVFHHLRHWGARR